MKVRGVYSFNSGREILQAGYATELTEVLEIIETVDASSLKTKTSKEKTMPGTLLYSPKRLNKAYRQEFQKRGWSKSRIDFEYSTEHYAEGYTPPVETLRGYREMDFVRNRVGVEVQFGKYAFMAYNVAAKMTIFHNLSVIDVGIEVVPVKELAMQMSTGVSYFEQFVWDLEQRGVADIDIPVLVLGIAP